MHKHNLIVERIKPKSYLFMCTGTRGNWVCSYRVELSKQWVKDRVTGVPLRARKKR